ncbi:MAG: hypothetical protein R2715_00375 [Ilumatobacteraceae bacterium]
MPSQEIEAIVFNNGRRSEDGSLVADTTTDINRLHAGDHLLFVLRPIGDDAWQINGAVDRDGSMVSVLGTCDPIIGGTLGALQSALGFPNEDSVLSWYLEEIARGTRPDIPAIIESAAPVWSDASALSRSLRSGDVPSDVRARLGVRFIRFEEIELLEDQLIVARSDSGV